jgi:hypothetical protein
VKKINRCEIYRCGFKDVDFDMTSILPESGFKYLYYPLYLESDHYDSELGAVLTYKIYASEVKVGRRKQWLFFCNKSHFITNDLNEFIIKYDDLISYRRNFGFIYVLKKDGKNTFKIGKAKTLRTRMNFFKINVPFEFEIVKAYGSSFYEDLERSIHKHLKQEDKHVKGEWFNLTKEDFERLDLYYSKKQQDNNEKEFTIPYIVLQTCF